MIKDTVYLIGYASGIAGADSHVAQGPVVLQQALLESQPQLSTYQWDAMIHPPISPLENITDIISQTCTQLAKKVSALTRKQLPFVVIGGDHTSAIGTWSGVYDALNDKGDIGLIWIDAHLDSHTPETTESGRIHGMPAACLLGHGYSSLTTILSESPKIKPENLCFIGVRSFERGEADFLKKLNVRIYFMDEVNEKGFDLVLKEAIEHVSAHTIGYGISLDLDAIDPIEAPGVDVPEPNGIKVNELKKGLSHAVFDSKLLATEIVEFDPSRDQNHITEKLIVSLLEILKSKIKG